MRTVAALLCTGFALAGPVTGEAQTSPLGTLAVDSERGCYAGGCTPPAGPWPPGNPVPGTTLAPLAHDASDDTPKPVKVCIGYCPGANSGMMVPWNWVDTRPIWVTDTLGYFSDPSQGGGGGQGKNPPENPRPRPNQR